MADLYTEARKRAEESIDEQAILDKYNAATTAQFNAQREQNRINENNFYNQMYNTQRTAMDTIRQSNAAAVASGASRGVQAAQELSSLLGLQQESVASATELAQANRQTAQEETAAVLENVLNAYKDAEAARQQAVTQEIQAESLKAEQSQANAAEAANLLNFYQQALANGDTAGASAAWSKLQTLFSNTSSTPGTTPGTDSDIAPGVDTPGNNTPVFTSGIQADGTLAFSTSDLNTKNVASIYTALEDAGYNFGIQQVVNLNDSADYDFIKQTDFNSEKTKGEAANYINAIKQAAASGQIHIGDIVQLNYGTQSNSRNYSYVYLGGNNFAKIAVNAFKDVSFYEGTQYGSILNNYANSHDHTKDTQDYVTQHYTGPYKVFVPQGYEIDVASRAGGDRSNHYILKIKKA